MYKLILLSLACVSCVTLPKYQCDTGENSSISERRLIFVSQDSAAFKGITITQAHIDSLQTISHVYWQDCSISDSLTFQSLINLKTLVLRNCESSFIEIDNPELYRIKLVGGNHDILYIKRLADNVYLDITSSNLNSLNGLNPVEERINHFYYACNEDIEGLEKVWFENIISYSFDPKALILQHSMDSLEYYFSTEGEIEYYQLLGRNVEMKPPTYYVFRFLIFRGKEVQQPFPTWL